MISTVGGAVRWLNANDLVARRSFLSRLQHYFVVVLSCSGAIAVILGVRTDLLSPIILLPVCVLLPRFEATIHEMLHPSR